MVRPPTPATLLASASVSISMNTSTPAATPITSPPAPLSPTEPPIDPLPPPPPPKTVDNPARVLVGPEKREFAVDRDLLASACPLFREGLEASSRRNKHLHAPCIWLAEEAPGMFELFVVWLQHRHSFRRVLDSAIKHRSKPGGISCTTIPNRLTTTSPARVGTGGNPDADPPRAQKLHWSLVRLHLFAARLSLNQLQDAAMDALQDLYLQSDWEVTPRLIRFLYGLNFDEGGAGEGGMSGTDRGGGGGGDDGGSGGGSATVRIRRWVTAMVAWQLVGAGGLLGGEDDVAPSTFGAFGGGGGPGGRGREPTSSPGSRGWQNRERARIVALFARYPEFGADYDAHVRKMASSGLDVRIKNPQLRMPANRLRNEERMFAFRQCSFHSHRASVGERTCPHTADGKGSATATKTKTGGSSAISSGRRRELHPHASSLPMPLVVLQMEPEYPRMASGWPTPPPPPFSGPPTGAQGVRV